MVENIKKKWRKYAKRDIPPIKRVVDFVWRKCYREALFFLWVSGIISIFYFEKSIEWFWKWGWMNHGIQNISANEKILGIIYYSTLILLAWYARETFDMKVIQNKQLGEAKKDRYLSRMPMIRLVSWVVEKKDVTKFKEVETVGNSKLKKEEELYYKIVYRNIGEDWAFIEAVNFWVANAISKKVEKIDVEGFSFNKTLYKNEEDYIATYSVKINETGDILFPAKLEIIFYDRYKNKFKYIAENKTGLAEPTPFLGIRDFVEEKTIYPLSLDK